jgi:uncharacterized protein (TIGR02646 family)
MQYIKKQHGPPVGWDNWFTKADGIRSYDYGRDYSALTQISQAKQFLIEEQCGLCAYCQQVISIENSSIEHVIPKEVNKELSTNYFNLVAVCKTQNKEEFTNRLHCDKEKGSDMISPLIFLANCDVSATSNNSYLAAYSDGTIVPKPNLKYEIENQVISFINIVNLNHTNLRERRAQDVLNGLIEAYRSIPVYHRGSFWRLQFQRFLLDKNQPFRQFLLIFIGNRIGIN